jgi:hypothetical protein
VGGVARVSRTSVNCLCHIPERDGVQCCGTASARVLLARRTLSLRSSHYFHTQEPFLPMAMEHGTHCRRRLRGDHATPTQMSCDSELWPGRNIGTLCLRGSENGERVQRHFAENTKTRSAKEKVQALAANSRADRGPSSACQTNRAESAARHTPSRVQRTAGPEGGSRPRRTRRE